MRRPARNAAVFLVVLSAAFLVWLWARTKEPPPSPEPAAAVSGKLGGKSILLEIVDPRTRRPIWRVHMTDATVAGDRLTAAAVRAEYLGAEAPASLTAARFEYVSVGTRARFSGDVKVLGPRFSLACAELTWDRTAHSFNITGGYSLTRDGASMHGEKLKASEDWRSIQALGAVRFTTVQTGK